MRDNYDDPLGRKFKDALENYEPEFDPAHWADMQQRLQNEEVIAPSPFRKYRYPALIALLFMASGGIFIANFLGEKETKLTQNSEKIEPKIIQTNPKSIQKIDSEQDVIKNPKLDLITESEKTIISGNPKMITPKIIATSKKSNAQIIAKKEEEKTISELNKLVSLVPHLDIKKPVLSAISEPKEAIAVEPASASKNSKLKWGLMLSGGGLNMPSNFQSLPFYGGGITGKYEISKKFSLKTGLSVNHLQFLKALPPPIYNNVVYALDPTNNMLLIKRFVERNAYARTVHANWFMAEIPVELDYQFSKRISISAGFTNQMILQEHYVYEYEIAPLDGLPETHKDVDLEGKFYPFSGSRIGLNFKSNVKGLPLEISPVINFSTRKLGKEEAQMNRYGLNLTFYLK